jgi:AcrR family transcriptional regulator
MPRAGLTTLRVIEEAEALADEVGLANLTLMALAARLGVRMPSLYKHVAGMDAMQRDLAVRARLELAGVLARAAAGRSKTEALQAMSVAYRRWATTHPGRYAATVRAPDADDTESGRASAEVLAVVVAVLEGFGLTGDDAIDATRALRSAIHGFIVLEQAGGFGLPRDVDRSFSRMVSGLAAAFSQWPRSDIPDT